MDATSQPAPGLDLAAIRQRLAGARGREFWTSLEELAETAEFQALLHREFPAQAAEWTDPVSRRHFLKLMGASLGLAGVTACTRQPLEKIVPYVEQPEIVVPGNPLYFATALPFNGFATGVIVESHEGRPTKIEGNPLHPASLGATSVFEQAAILQLYDPDRSRVIRQSGDPGTWERFLTAVVRAVSQQATRQGAGLRVLTGTVTSPTLAAQLQALLDRHPQARWHAYEPWPRDAEREGARLAFGEPLEARYNFQQADVILSLDADFLFAHPERLRHTREFARKRQAAALPGQLEPTSASSMNRLYQVESTPTITGTMADHRQPLAAGWVGRFAHAVIAHFDGATSGGIAIPDIPSAWIQAVAQDLQRHPGRSLVLAGEQQPPEVHALAHWMNHVLGNVGRTVVYLPPVEAHPVNRLASLRELSADMLAGRVELLVILDENPVFTAPADVSFADALAKVPVSVHLGLYYDETAARCLWHLPAAHPLEAWSDLRAFDGTASIVQPLIAPLHSGLTAHEVLAALLQSPITSPYEMVREHWRARQPAADFEAWWTRALHDGVIADSAAAPRNVALQYRPAPAPAVPPALSPANLEVTFRPDPTVWDGRFANNAWLQETPKPISKLTWDNPALISPGLAETLGVSNGDLITLRLQGRTLTAAVWIMPGQPAFSVTLYLGYGGRFGEAPGAEQGFNAYRLRGADAFAFAPGLELQRAGGRYSLAATQLHHRLEGRAHVRVGTLEQFRADPGFAHEAGGSHGPMLYNLTAQRQTEYQWGMVVNLNTCIGCNACTVACQAENNIPVVGKAEVRRGREMHWIRVDSYFLGGLENPQVVHQPVPCMHCETAPCEYVCPVAATSHSHEGLNEMTYNRCIGTRYCSNNCPYKVRRFNFFTFAERYSNPSLRLMLNPQVTVRTRGVMEKCTYCIQRISRERIAAKRDHRPIPDGAVTPACAQACPAEAIVFGDVSDPETRVSRWKALPLNYGMLAELNTRPRTTYLAKLLNVNAGMAASAGTVPAGNKTDAHARL